MYIYERRKGFRATSEHSSFCISMSVLVNVCFAKNFISGGIQYPLLIGKSPLKEKTRSGQVVNAAVWFSGGTGLSYRPGDQLS
jgi:hypothetical protein